MFKFITHDNRNPYFNLASEEYLLKIKGGYYFYLWINSPAVIVGINQNTLQEVNLGYTEQSGIKVVRRLTGGGAVYHDLNNICYTVIAPYDDGVDNYKKFTAPVIEYLNSLGVKAEFSGRNDITVEGKKISGNAQTVYDGRIMHHGTLLFKTDMSVLGSALKENKLKMQSKGIKSVRARVTNIYDCLPVKISVEEFYNGLCAKFKENCQSYSFDATDLAEINRLVDEKYSKYEWNMGRSPIGKSKFEARFGFGTMAISFDVVSGVIQNAEIFGDFFALKDIKPLCDALSGCKFVLEEVRVAIADAEDYIRGADGSVIAESLFGLTE